ncbi:MAG: leucine-rich repeat protein [Clostridia bacterium]|nr:leucine-rich repeat protein [Clostridia bacterium]
MKLLKKLSAILLAIVLLFGSMPLADLGLENLFTAKATAASGELLEYDKIYSEYIYTLTDDFLLGEGITIRKYIGNKKDIVVPATIEGLPVTEIDSGAFSPKYADSYNPYINSLCSDIESVTLPDSVRIIGKNAFDNCKKLQYINMPEELEGIEEKAFLNCSSLNEPDLSNNGVEYIGSFAFGGTKFKKLSIGSLYDSVRFRAREYFLTGSSVEELTIVSESIWLYEYSLMNYVLKTVTLNGEVDLSWEVFGETQAEYLPETINVYNNIFRGTYDALESFYGYCGEVSDESNDWITFTIPAEPRQFLTEGNYQYYLNKNGDAVINRYSGKERNVTIPEKLGGATVTTIGYDAFIANDYINTVSIPDTVTHIQSSAFASCEGLVTVDLSSNLKSIGYEAFERCYALRSITIPEGVTTLASMTFFDCENLRSVQAKGVTKILYDAFSLCSSVCEAEFSDELNYVGSGAFSSCESLAYFPYDKNLTYIGESAFYGTAIKHFEFNDAIKEINDKAFNWCEFLETVIFPSNLERIGAYAFHSCEKLKEINLLDTVTTIGARAFEYCRSLEGTLTIPESLTTLGRESFKETGFVALNYNAISMHYTSALNFLPFTTVNFGSKVTRIPSSLLNGCSEIEYITLPETVKSIGDGAFSNCKKLKSITLPDSLVTIGVGAFYCCESLESIELPDGLSVVKANAFMDCNKITELTIPGSVIKFSATAFPESLTTLHFNAENCSFTDLSYSESLGTYTSPFINTQITNVTISNSIKRIPSYMFCGVKTLESITLPDSVTEVGKESFRDSSIKNIRLSENLIVIEERAFYNTSVKIEGNKLPDGTRMIGKEAFACCKGLEEIYIPDSVVDIAEGAFEECENLTKVRMSPNVRLIADNAFKNCVALYEFIWDSDIKLIADQAFYNCRALTDFDFTGVELLYPNSFTYTGVTLVTLGEDKAEGATNLIAIEMQSFKDCENLEAVAIGGNIATIKSEAFASCSSLSTVVISDSVINIAPDAFKDCDAITIYCTENSYAYNYAIKNNIPVTTFAVSPIPNQTYTGSAIEPEVNVSVSGEKIMENTDFTVKYADNINVGTAKVTVSGKGIYKVLSSIANFTIITKSIAPVTFAEISEQDYTGEAVIPTLTVTDGNRVLEEGVDYTVTYKNNVEEGTATVTIQGIGNYHGTASTSFQIRELSTSQSASNKILDFLTSLWLKIVSFFTSIFN